MERQRRMTMKDATSVVEAAAAAAAVALALS